jgi:argininosuccinate synthase
MKKALLAFSGGLDTTFCIPYLKEKGYTVVTATVNTGGFSKKQLSEIAAKAKKMGVAKHYECNAEKALYETIASYIIKANYLKGGVYPACVGPERNVIVAEMAKIAAKEKPDAIVHGSTGAGNDQVRFDLALRALVPNCEIIAPIRDENITREEEVALLKKNGYEVSAASGKYSINVGLLGTTIGGVETITSEKELPDEAFPTVAGLNKAKKGALEFSATFKGGLPVKLNEKALSGVEIIKQLNALGAEYGFGKDYHIGTTIIGIKGRIGFEAPALKILVKAHTELEKLVLTSKQIFWKNTLGTVYGDMIHEGLFFDPLVKDIEKFLDSSSEFVEGEVSIRISGGNLSITSLKSPYSLLQSKHGRYGEKTGSWSGLDAKGFCKLYGTESINAYLTHKEAK